MKKCLLTASICLLIGNTLWAVLLNFESLIWPGLLIEILTPATAGFYAFRQNSVKKIRSGCLIWLLAIFGFAAGNALFEALGGQSDFSSWYGAALTTILTSPYCALSVALGAWMGTLSKKLPHTTSH